MYAIYREEMGVFSGAWSMSNDIPPEKIMFLVSL